MSFPRYPAYKDSGVAWIGEVPADWQVLRLRVAASLNPSKQETSHLPPETLVTFLPMEAVGEDGSIDPSRERPLSEVLEGYTYLRDGDVAFAKITPCFENGKGALMRSLRNGIGFGTTELTVMRPREDRTIAEFLNYWIASRTFRQIGEAHMYGAGGQKRVPESMVRDFRVPLPSLPEQSAIAAFLDRETAKIDALVAEQRRLMDLLREKRQAVISHAVTKGINPDAPMKDSGVEWLGDIPADWDCLPLGYLVRGNNAGEVIDRSYWGGEDELLYTCAVAPLLCDYPDFPQHKRTGPHDLLLTRNGTPYVHLPVVGSIYTNVVQRVTLPSTTNREFVAHALAVAARNLRGYGVSIESLNYEMWKQLRVVMPTLDVQIAIVQYVKHAARQLDELLQSAEDCLRLLQERRAALITAAVTGRFDVRGAAVEAA